MAKVSRPLIYGGLAVVAVIAYSLYGAEPEGGSGVQARRSGGNSRATSQAEELFTEEDRTAVFERLNEPVNNAFNPLVAREGSSGPGGGLLPNQLPPSFTDGEAGWAYTGTVEINGVPSALLENDSTGDGMYLMVGEKLKRSTITMIAPTYIEVEGFTGRSVRLELLADLPEDDDFYDGLEIEPVRPEIGDQLNGLIRGGGATGNRVPETSEQQ